MNLARTQAAYDAASEGQAAADASLEYIPFKNIAFSVHHFLGPSG